MNECLHACMAGMIFTYFIESLQFTEEKFSLRHMSQHVQQCSYIEHPGIQESEKKHFSKVYGVNRRSILCDLPYFDVTSQLPQDIMHLLFEGLFHLQIKLLLNYLFSDISVSIYIS